MSSDPYVGDYIKVLRHVEEKYQGQTGHIIEQTDPRIFSEKEWPLCPPGGTTGPGNVWVYFDEPVKNKHTWQVATAALIVVKPWAPPSTPEDIEVFLNG